VNATLPKDVSPETVTLEEALELISAKAAKGGTGKSKTTRKPAVKAKTTKAKAVAKSMPKKAATKAPTNKPTAKKPTKKVA